MWCYLFYSLIFLAYLGVFWGLPFYGEDTAKGAIKLSLILHGFILFVFALVIAGTKCGVLD